MSNLDVALRLRMINQIGGPAKDAKRELEGISTAAKKLDGAKAERLARELGKTRIEAKGAGSALQSVSLGAKKLDSTQADRLAARLRTATVQSDRLAQSMRRVRAEAHAVEGGHAGAGAAPFLAAGGKMLGAIGGAYAAYQGASAVKRSFQDFAELDRRMTRLGVTAEATSAQVKGATANVRAWAQKYAMPVEQVLLGLEDLVTQGKELPVAEAMMDPIVQAAQASGAAVKDMAGTAGAMLNNLKIKAEQLPEAFDKLAYAGKKGQFELKGMAHYFPELGANWARAGQEGIGHLADLAAALQTVRKQTGADDKTFAGIRDLLTKIDSTDVQNNFKKMGVDLENELRRAKKEGKPLFDTIIELTERATKNDMSLLPKLFTENESRTAINALIALKHEFRSLRSEINTKSAGTITNDIVPVTNDAQASIQRLANAWSAAGTAVGKFVAEATPAVPLLERISRGIDSAREYMSGEGDKKDAKKDEPRVDQPAGPKSSYPGRFQSWAHAKATREALLGPIAPKSSFPGRFQGAAHAAAKAQHEREVRAATVARGPMTPRPIERNFTPLPHVRNYSPRPKEVASEAEEAMRRINRVISSEGAKAIAETKSITDQIKAIFNFTVSPTISPRLGGTHKPSTAPAASGKQAAAGGRVHIVNHITVNGAGKDGRQIAAAIGRQFAQLGNANSALFDIG